MRIIIAYPTTAGTEALLGRHGVSYRPDLAGRDRLPLREAIAEFLPDVIVTDQEPDPADLMAWRGLMPDTRLFVLVKEQSNTGERRIVHLQAGLSLHRVCPSGSSSDLAVLREAERLYTREVTSAASQAAVQVRRARQAGPDESVVVVGAGIVGLMTALHLVRAEYRVALVDARPDPRSSADWRSFGCTRGGSNARMFTLTEADNYNNQDASRETSPIFRIPVSQCGWRICAPESLCPREHKWIEHHEQLAPWLARVYNDDIFSFNKESRSLWEDLRLSMPQLFDGAELRRHILRLYTDQAHLEWSSARQEAVGALRRRLEPCEIRARYPALADACKTGLIVGGLEVFGFTVNVHNLVSRMLDALEHAGTVMSWGTGVREIVSGNDSRVASLFTDAGHVKADHYVLSPGAYGQELLAGTASASLIQGVLGVWMTLPNLEPKLHNSLKIARKGHMADDANVTVARDAQGDDVLLYGSGYGYTGLRPDNIRPAELQALYAAVEENVRTFFPRGHAAAVESGLLFSSRRLCVRPWTATGLGVFEILPATSGLLIVTGGHNTGGFAQSPSVAHAVLSALRGLSHPMHELYHPHRLGKVCTLVAAAESATREPAWGLSDPGPVAPLSQSAGDS